MRNFRPLPLQQEDDKRENSTDIPRCLPSMLRLFQLQQEEKTQPVAMQDRESFLPGKAGLHADFRGDNGSKGDTVRWLSQSGVYKMPFNVE